MRNHPSSQISEAEDHLRTVIAKVRSFDLSVRNLGVYNHSRIEMMRAVNEAERFLNGDEQTEIKDVEHKHNIFDQNRSTRRNDEFR
jgi:hypothetical protein